MYYIRYYLICTAAIINVLNDFARTLDPDPNAGNNISIPLSNNGVDITHYGTEFVATEEMASAMSEYFSSNPQTAAMVALFRFNDDVEVMRKEFMDIPRLVVINNRSYKNYSFWDFVSYHGLSPLDNM